MLSRSAGIYVPNRHRHAVTDPDRRLQCFRRRALQAINLDEVQSNGYSFQIELTHKLWRAGYKIVEVPIIFTDRAEGHSKMSGTFLGSALDGWKLCFKTACAAGRASA